MKDEENSSAPDSESETRARTRRLLIFWVIVATVFLGGNFLYGMVLYTSNDRTQCLSCHRFSGPGRMWERSDRHSEGLTCPRCHGLLPTQQGRCGAFSAHPDVVNPNCMGCHGRILAGGPLHKEVEVRLAGQADGGDSGAKVYRWRLEDLMYTWHLKKKICLCTDCHGNVAHEKASDSGTPHTPHLAYCRECHYHSAKDDYVQVLPLPEIRAEKSAAAVEE